MAAVEGEDENHWPGYVDALTTMVMMLIFIMTILAIAVFGLSQNVSRALVEKVAKAAGIAAPSASESVDSFAARIAADIEARRQATPPLPPPPREAQPARQPIEKAEGAPTGPAEGAALRIATRSDPPPAPPPTPVTLGGARTLTLTFKDRATGLDGAAQSALAERIAPARAGHFTVEAVADGEGAVSDQRRVAFYRLMVVRKHLMSLGIPAEAITARVLDLRDRDARDTVRITPGS